ncbi:glutamate--tRNA ligase [Roseisolibacter sp. H3M3-2]|uniref:glutamate--tRNA ligase n=1 Tax=Roseisolibacter sp. H3M3-2 TaxID=3031323 RepID=UPI0023DBC1B0|nr:glutamate--tRNA ligase [Roseisolibacter sp. H3M3-2]MDF1502786.1 glutamate--tRNA ligase [Roseisolibacter sp. H3M3-2]
MAPVPRLRFAPSPTGYLHVGGARTALFNWLYARKHGGQFLLRVEDTDRARSTDASTRAIFEGMEWLGLDWDEPPVYQGANLPRHQADARRLLDAGAAYRCFCTAAELDEQRSAAEARGEAFRYDRRCDRLTAEEVARRVERGDPYVVRFRMPEGETAWVDMVHGRIAFPNKDIGEGDFIVLRSDGTPIYNMAVVSDDIAMAITLVMRGDDHISNTPKQILLYQALGSPLPQFAHLPMIHGTDGKKLSKRHGATAVGDYRHLGILPEAMNNFLALLGWNPGGDREVMTRAEMVELFSEDGLSRKAAVFDPQKLEWMNGQHLMAMPLDALAPRVAEAVEGAGLATAADLAARPDFFRLLLELLRVRARTIDELVRQAVPYLRDALDFDADAVAKLWLKDPAQADALLGASREALAGLSSWDAAAMEPALRAAAEGMGVGAGKLFQPLRLALTGVTATPGMFDVLMLLGRDRSLARIDAARARIGAA